MEQRAAAAAGTAAAAEAAAAAAAAAEKGNINGAGPETETEETLLRFRETIDSKFKGNHLLLTAVL